MSSKLSPILVLGLLACGASAEITPRPAMSAQPAQADSAIENDRLARHTATAARVEVLLSQWRTEIEAARAQRAESPATEESERNGDEDVPFSFQGSLEEADLISVEWLGEHEDEGSNAAVALVIFDRAPDQSDMFSFGPPENWLSDTRSGYLVGPNTEVDIAEHLIRDGEDDCRHFSEYDVEVSLGGDETLGTLEGPEDAVLYFWLEQGRLRTQTPGCQSAIHEHAEIVQGPCGESLVCGETLAVAGEHDRACLRALRSLERDTAEAFERIVPAPAAFASAHPVTRATDNFRARPARGEARACSAPPRPLRLAALASLLASAHDDAVGRLLADPSEDADDESQLDADARAEVERMADAQRAEHRRAWRSVHFSCSSHGGFAFQLADGVRFFDGTGVVALHEHDTSEYDTGQHEMFPLERFDADGDGYLDWWTKESWAGYEDRDQICMSEATQCSAVLVTRHGIERLSCDTRFVQTPEGVLVWEPREGEDHIGGLGGDAELAGQITQLQALIENAEAWRYGPQRHLARTLGAPMHGNTSELPEALERAGILNAGDRVSRLLRYQDDGAANAERRSPASPD